MSGLMEMRKTHLVLFAVLLLIGVTLQSDRKKRQTMTCGAGWVRSDQVVKCYLYGRVKVNWFTAVSLCKAFGAKLLETKSENEHNMTSIIMGMSRIDEVWTGGTNMLSGSEWRWLSNGDVIGPFTAWNDPNPNNSGGDEHCMAIRAAGGYRWNHINCDVNNIFVCEKSPSWT